MPKSRILLFLSALGTLGSLWWVWFEHETRSPLTLLASAEDRLNRVDIDEHQLDYDTALRELDLALHLAELSGDTPLLREIRKKRIGVYQRRKAFRLALQEAEEMLAETPDDPDLLNEVALALISLGDRERAVEVSRRLIEIERSALNLNTLARVQLLLAEGIQEEIGALLTDALGDDQAAQSIESVRHVIALPEGSTKRHSILDHINEILTPSGRNEECLGLISQATHQSDRARQNLIASLDDSITTYAVDALVRRYLLAGAPHLVADLGQIALQGLQLQGARGTALTTGRALVSNDRIAAASALLLRSRQRDRGLYSFQFVPVSDLVDWCQLLLELEDWKSLDWASGILAKRAHRSMGLGALPRFYMGMAAYHLGEWKRALASFQAFARDRMGRNPVPFARMESNLRAFECAKRLKSASLQRQAMLEITSQSEDPEWDRSLRRRIGEIWRQQAQRQFKDGDPLKAEVSMTNAVRLMPDRTDVLMDDWTQIGEIALAKRGRRFLNEQGVPSAARPNRGGGPYEHFIYGRHYAEQGQPLRAISLLEPFAIEYPGFVPAEELLARAYFDVRDFNGAARIWVALTRERPGNPQLAKSLHQIPSDRFPPDLRVEWTRHSPRAAALVGVAEQLIEDGQGFAALSALRQPSNEPMHGHALLLWGQLTIEQARWTECVRLLEGLPADDPWFPSTVGYSLEAAAKSEIPKGMADPLVSVVDKVKSAPVLLVEPTLKGINALISVGKYPKARDLLNNLDQREIDSSGVVVLEAAMVELLFGRDDRALAYLDRAESFFDDGEIVVGRILFAANQGDWKVVADEARALAKRPFSRRGAYQQALAVALQGKFDAARQLLADPLQEAFPDPLHTLLIEACDALLTESEETADTDPSRRFLGRLDAERDPRQVICMLLALECPPWAAWTLDKLRGLPEELLISPWPRYLEAAALLGLDQNLEAIQNLKAMALNEPRVPFAWFLLEKVERERLETDSAPELLALRADRIRAAGTAGLSPLQLAVVMSHTVELLGQPRRALKILENAQEEHPDDMALAIRVAQKRSAIGDSTAAIDDYNRLLSPAMEAGFDLVPEYLELLRAAALHGDISNSAWWSYLEAIEAQRLDDPSIARELARRTIETADQRSDWGVGRAWERLERFRMRTQNAPIEDLRQGEAQRWFDLFLEHDPRRAFEFAQAELLVRPYSPTMWSLSAQALAAGGELRRAANEFRTILAIVPDPDIQRRLADLYVDLGENRKRIESLLEQAQKRRRTEPELELIRARSLIAGGGKVRDTGIRTLVQFWLDRDDLPEIDPWQLGKELVVALLLRNSKADPGSAKRVLRELAPLVSDPLEREVLRIFEIFARHLDKEQRRPGRAG